MPMLMTCLWQSLSRSSTQSSAVWATWERCWPVSAALQPVLSLLLALTARQHHPAALLSDERLQHCCLTRGLALPHSSLCGLCTLFLLCRGLHGQLMHLCASKRQFCATTARQLMGSNCMQAPHQVCWEALTCYGPAARCSPHTRSSADIHCTFWRSQLATNSPF